MFELISGFGVWNRRYFVLKESTMYYWNHPNDEGAKVWEDHRSDVHAAQHRQRRLKSAFILQEAENSMALSDCYQSVRAVQRDLCARPFTFELLSERPHQQGRGGQALAR